MIVTCRKDVPSRWIGFTVLPWASFAFNFAVVNAAFVFSVKKFVENPAGVAFVLSLPGFLAMIVAPCSCFLSDRVWTRFGRRKPFILSGCSCMIFALVAMPLAPNFWTLLAAYVLYHLGDGISMPKDPLRQEVVPPHERGRATGLLTWYQNLVAVVFYSVILGRFDDTRFFAGFPLHGEVVIYWSAGLLLTVMVMLVALGIKEVDQKSSLVGQRFSLRNFVGGLLDRELWPVYLLVVTFGLLNFFSGFGPFLSTLLYTDQWSYTKQEMGMNVAIGGVVNVFIIAILTFFADRMPRMTAFRVLIVFSLVWNVLYYCYVEFVLPDKRPTLIEIILFGEVLSILSILKNLIYTPLVYDYVRRNKMGTFSAGEQIATRGMQLFTLNGIGIFVWTWATLFQPPAGEMTRVVLKEGATEDSFVQTLRRESWLYARDGSEAAPKSVSARVWQADGVTASEGRAWEIRLKDKDSEKLASERMNLEEKRTPLLAEEKRLRDDALVSEGRGNSVEAGKFREEAEARQSQSSELTRRIDEIDATLAARADSLKTQVTAKLGNRLIAEGDQVLDARVGQALVLEFSAKTRPEGAVLDRMLGDLRAELPGVVGLRPLKLETGYGISASVLLNGEDEVELGAKLKAALLRCAEVRSRGLFDAEPMLLGSSREKAFTMELRVVEAPVSTYVSPVTRIVNGVLGFFDRVPSPTQKLSAMARTLSVPGESQHVRVSLGSDTRTLSVTALFQPGAARSEAADPVARRLAELLPAAEAHEALPRARAFYDRVEKAAAIQRITVVHPVLSASYAPLRYDYMGGYLWVFFVGLIGITLTFVFSRLETRGLISKRGVEEAKAS